jgi:hypothetical protein
VNIFALFSLQLKTQASQSTITLVSAILVLIRQILLVKVVYVLGISCQAPVHQEDLL